MPAIQPAILKQQAVLLADHFYDPPAYIRSLHHLLDYYADRTRHPKVSGNPTPVLPAYRVHPPVLRTLLQELTPSAIQDPTQGLAFCDALWEVSYIEFKQLAGLLIGQLPAKNPEPLVQRLVSWLTPDLESSMIKFIMEQSFEKLHREHPLAMESMVQDWLLMKDPFYKRLGLHALLALILQLEYDNLPVFFRMIQPYACEIPTGLRPDVLDIITALAQRSPTETAFFLMQTLRLPESRDTAWLIRQSINIFPKNLQNDLRGAARSANEKE